MHACIYRERHIVLCQNLQDAAGLRRCVRMPSGLEEAAELTAKELAKEAGDAATVLEVHTDH